MHATRLNVLLVIGIFPISLTFSYTCYACRKPIDKKDYHHFTSDGYLGHKRMHCPQYFLDKYFKDATELVNAARVKEAEVQARIDLKDKIAEESEENRRRKIVIKVLQSFIRLIEQ
jgi:hypothetical protein